MTPEQKVVAAARRFIRHDTPDTWAGLKRALLILDGQDVDEEEPVWTQASWGDVGKGDPVRLSADAPESVVRQVHDEPWPPVERGPEVTVTLKGAGTYTFPRSGPVEILMDTKRRAEHDIATKET